MSTELTERAAGAFVTIPEPEQTWAAQTEAMMKPILVTTKHRGVFAGLVPDDANLDHTTMRLVDARMAIRWATTRGVAELAEVGPNAETKIGSTATLEALHDITAVWAVSPEAWERWLTA